MKKVLFIFLLFLNSYFLAYSQEETSNWYFGNGAGLHFNNDGSVNAVTDGQLNTLEGCTTISNEFGDLLFYTDGITVYDRNHSIMMNGTGLYGDPSSTQSALIIPKPEDPNIFYIFTVDTSFSQRDSDEGLNYSIVDISKNNGNGSVVDKNMNLLEDCSEKIAAVIKDCSNKTIWVITLASEDGKKPSSLNNDIFFNTYHAFEINAAGVNSTAVKTSVNSEIRDPRGYLKLSPDGTKLASANMEDGLFIYDFNADTGKVSNQQEIKLSIENKAFYSVEFSPNNQYLYAVSYNNLNINIVSGHSSSLLQYDLLASDIISSLEILETKSVFRGALQLGNNGKIYRTTPLNYFTGTSYLGVIHNPNKKGVAANYEHNAIFLNEKLANQGLPPFIQSFFNKTDLIKNDDGTTSSSLKICEGESFILEAENFPGATYNWSINGVNFKGTNIHEIKSATTDDTGRYKLEIILANAKKCPIIGESIIKVNSLPEANNITLTQCDADSNSSDGYTSINLEQIIKDKTLSYFFYETIADRNNDNSPIENPDNYTNKTPNQAIYYKVVNKFECENFGEITLKIKPIDLKATTPISLYECDENPNDNILTATFDILSYANMTYSSPNDYTFYTTIEDAILEQNPITKPLATEATIIFGREENTNQCEDIFEINLIVNPLPQPNLEPSYILCTDNPILNINASSKFDSYKWLKIEGNIEKEISSKETATISEIGTYVLEVGTIYNQNGKQNICTNSTIFKVTSSSKAIIENIKIKDISNNNTIEFFVSGEGDYEYSLNNGVDYQDSPFFNNVLPGIISVLVRDKNGCGTTPTKINVIGYPKFFTPNGDASNDTWQIVGANDMFQANSTIAIFDRYGSLIAKISPTAKGWDGTINGHPLPSSNYWFKVNLEDGREFKGNFALKR